MYKLIACDVDGTLFDGSFTVSDTNKIAIAKAQDKGVIFSLCSGRSYKSLKIIAKDFGINAKGNYIVGFNGGLIYDFYNSHVVKQENLGLSVGVQIAELFKEMPRDIEMVVYIDAEHVLFEAGAEYAPIYLKTSRCHWKDTQRILGDLKNLSNIAKIIFLGENSSLRQFEKELAGRLGKETSIFFTGEYMLETSPATSTKGNGVRWLCQKYEIDLAEVICIGDNYNDISMLKEAGLGVAVANAVPAVKEIADYITENDCTNGAVAEVIDKFVL